MAQAHALHADGINFAFFDLLWSKCSSEVKVSSSEIKSSPTLRVPDTVLFLFGLPHQWYFTSKNGGPHRDHTTILRKRRANLTLENIIEVFLTKASSRGIVGDDEVVAYFISSKTEAAATNNGLNASLDAYDAVVDNEMACSIEYFNKKTLREFLQPGKHNKSGILQRFINPHGGTHNSCIRAVWTPKMCILERRRTKQSLHDNRFALYERAITFDGPDVYSISVPLRGNVLSSRVEKICDEIARHIEEVSNNDADLGVGRMVMNFKVDGNGRVWILWSDSIRLETGINENTTNSTSQPLNMNTVVKLPSSIKLSQVPSHDTNAKLENEQSSALCPSCGKHQNNEHYHDISYKTVIRHFEKTMEMLGLELNKIPHPSTSWPPERCFIKAAGGVGFGTVTNQQQKSIEAMTIPPVIRHCHPKLQVKGYQMYRDDPLFVQKTCEVCEDCFLAYSKLKSSAFLMVHPIEPKDDFEYEIPAVTTKNAMLKSGEKVNHNAPESSLDTKDFGSPPNIPTAILEPPKSASMESVEAVDATRNTTQEKLPDYSEDAQRELGHMIDLKKKLLSAKPKKTVNPYQEDLTKYS